MTTSRFLALALAVGVATCQANAQSVTLRMNLKPGTTYRQQTKMTTAMNMGNQPMTMNMDQTMATKVSQKTAKGFKVKTTVEAIKVTGTGPMANGGKSVEDSMRGKTMESEIDLRGRTVGEVKGLPGMSQMGGMAGGSGAGISGVEFPEGPVKVGSSWTTTMDLAKMLGSQSGMKMSGKPMTTKYTVKAISGQTVTLAIAVTANYAMTMGGGSGNQASGQKMNMTIAMSGTGTTVIDTTTGLPKSTDMKMTNTTNMGTMVMKQTITVTSRMK